MGEELEEKNKGVRKEEILQLSDDLNMDWGSKKSNR